MVTIFSLSFQDSFYKAYVELGIDARNAHLTIYPSNSVWLKNSLISIQKDEMPLMTIDDEFAEFVNALEDVEIGTPIIEAGGVFYTKEGQMQSASTITGVRGEDFKAIFPGIELLEGDDDITVDPEKDFIPLLRWQVRNNERVQNIDVFSIEDFIVKADIETFKDNIQKNFPDLLVNVYEGDDGTNQLIVDLNDMLDHENLYDEIHSYDMTNYDVKALVEQIQSMTFDDVQNLRNWNKRLIRSMYPDVIHEVPESIALNKPMGLFMGSTDDTRPPILLPIEFVGYCEGIPEFYGYNFIDLKIMQNYIDLSEEDCTAYLIRLKDVQALDRVQKLISDYIETRGFDYQVVDYKFIGNKTHMPLATGVSIVFKSLMVIFLLISIFFVSYIVTLSIIRRRKEMGTNIVLGMDPYDNMLILLGENFVLMTVSWMAASLLMGLGLNYLAQNGLGGIIFFPRGKLFFRMDWAYFYKAYLFITIPGMLASLLPTLKIKNVTLVELLKGELSPRQKRSTSSSTVSESKSQSGFALIMKLAYRNIFANKRRNMMIFVIFTLVISVLYLFLAYGDGVVANFRNGFQALNDPRADIVVTKKGFSTLYEVNPHSEDLIDMPIEDGQRVYEMLEGMPFVEETYFKTVPVTLDLFVHNTRFKELSFRGIDENMFAYLEDKIEIVDGRMIEPSDENVILMNEVNREALGAAVGETVTALGSDLFHHVVTEDFQLIGYYKPKIDTPFFTSIVFSDMKGYNHISGYTSKEINYINVHVKQGTAVKRRVEALNQWAKDNEVAVEFHAYGDLFVQDDEKYGAGRKMIMALTYLVIVFVMIGISNMILINLYDRRKEIGTYYCIGAEKSLLMWVYTLELMMVNMAATFVGVIIGFAMQQFINGLEISSSNPGIQIAYGGSVFYLDFNPVSTVLLFVSVLLITLTISMMALKSSLSVSPIVALQETDE